jgi:uncharacterized protein (TIGR02145 family)
MKRIIFLLLIVKYSTVIHSQVDISPFKLDVHIPFMDYQTKGVVINLAKDIRDPLPYKYLSSTDTFVGFNTEQIRTSIISNFQSILSCNFDRVSISENEPDSGLLLIVDTIQANVTFKSKDFYEVMSVINNDYYNIIYGLKFYYSAKLLYDGKPINKVSGVTNEVFFSVYKPVNPISLNSVLLSTWIYPVQLIYKEELVNCLNMISEETFTNEILKNVYDASKNDELNIPQNLNPKSIILKISNTPENTALNIRTELISKGYTFNPKNAAYIVKVEAPRSTTFHVAVYNNYSKQKIREFNTGYSLTKGVPYIISELGNITAGQNFDNLNAKNISSFNYGTLYDIDKNEYRTLQIGNQVWMIDNLKTTRLHDGSSISLITSLNSLTDYKNGAYCWYNFDQEFKNDYGALYNFYTVETERICPAGWHVPNYNEWLTLINFTGEEKLAGSKLKEAGSKHWAVPCDETTNETGFFALPGGHFLPENSVFSNIYNVGMWWRADQGRVILKYDMEKTILLKPGILSEYPKNCFFSIRCLQD